MPTFRCTKECFFKSRIWRPGEIYRGDNEGHKCFEELEDIDPQLGPKLAHTDRLKLIEAAVLSMDQADDRNWTARGLPAVEAVSMLTKFETTRVEIEEATSMRRDTKSFSGSAPKALSELNPQTDIPAIQ